MSSAIKTDPARPITARLGISRGRHNSARAFVITGQPASPGIATGRARILSSLADIQHLVEGDEAVLPDSNSAWFSVLGHVAGVITENGGSLSNFASLASEAAVPTVTGVAGAGALITDRVVIRIDGRTGQVSINL
jgi:phosphoenolpyruvate synthase/pyruvate phosphate dikinase